MHGGELLFLSASGYSANFKVIGAAVNSGGSIPCYWRASGLNILRPSQAGDQYRYPRNPGNMLTVSASGYDIHKHRLGFGEEHRIFVSRRPGFMVVASDEAVWQELKGSDYTTPLLREWLPHLVRELKSRSLLVECEVHPYRKRKEGEEEDENSREYQSGAPILSCCVLSCLTKDVDNIVMDGLRSKAITIDSERRDEQSIDDRGVACMP